MKRITTFLITAVAAGVLAGCGNASTESVPLAAPAADQALPDVDLPGRVSDAFYRLTPSEVAIAGYGIAANTALNDKMASCMADAGFTYTGARLFAAVGTTLDRSVKAAYGTDPEWGNPPDRYGTAPNAAAAARAVLAVEERAVAPGAAKEAAGVRAPGYDAAFEACVNSIPPQEPWDDTARLTLKAEFEQIATDTQKLPGFAKLASGYEQCMVKRGARISAPEQVLTVAPAARDADLACRAPMFDAFINLNADAWEAWLASNAAEFERVDAELAKMERVAAEAFERR